MATLIKVLDEEVKIVPNNLYEILLIDHETGDTSQYDSVTGTVTIDTPGYNGTSNKATYDAGGANYGLVLPTITLSDFYIKLDFYFNYAPDGTLKIDFPIGVAILSTSFGEIRTQINQAISSSYDLRLGIVDDVAGVTSDYAVTLTANTTYHVELIADVSSGSGVVQLWVNSVLYVNKTNVDIDSTLANITNIRAGSTGAGGGTGRHDELRIITVNDAVAVLGSNQILDETTQFVENIVHLLTLVDLVKVLNEIIQLAIISDLNRFAAFNFCNPLDWVLPSPDSAIDEEDRAQLWGVYVPDPVGAVEGMYLLNLMRQIGETVNLYLIGAANVLIDHETNDFSQYTVEPDDGSIITPGYNSTTRKAQIEATSANPGSVTIASPISGLFVISFYLDVSDLTYQVDTSHIIGIRVLASSDAVVWTQVNGDVSPYTVGVVINDDNDATTATTPVAITDVVHKYELKVYKATSGSSNDGRVEFYIDGILDSTLLGIDIFDRFAAIDSVEIGNIDTIPAMDGQFFIDEIAIFSVTNTAIFILGSGFKLVISEVLQVSEAIQKVFSLIGRIISEGINISEINIDIKGKIVVLLETLNLIDGAQRVLGFFKFNNETLQVSDANVRILGLFKLISDSIEIPEIIVNAYDYLKVIGETLQISENVLRVLTMVRTLNDGLGLTIREGVVRAVGWARIIGETLNLLELQLGPFGAFFRVINEVLNTNEVLNRLSLLVRSVDDTINLIENISRVRGFTKIISETLNFSFVVLVVFEFVSIIDETLHVSTAINRARTFVKIAVDTINISELVSRFSGSLRVITETINIVTANLRKVNLGRVINEIVNVTTSILKPLSIFKIINEIFNVSEGILKRRGLARIVNEYLLIFEVVLKVRNYIRAISENINVVEIILRWRGITQVTEETVDIGETVSGSAVLYLISRGVKRTGILLSNTLRAIQFINREV